VTFDVVRESADLWLSVLDPEVGGAGISVPGKTDAAGVGDDELAEISDERPVDVAVDRQGGSQRPVGLCQDVVRSVA
jgi:hypothetical protein